MDMKLKYHKTEKGEEEFKDRTHGLSAQLRRVLILVDGDSTVEKIVQKGLGLPDIVPSLEELEKKGFIRPSQGDPITSVKEELAAAARQILGTHADKVIVKINEAPNTIEGLERSMDSCKKLVKLLIDEKKADEMAEKCSEVIERLRK